MIYFNNVSKIYPNKAVSLSDVSFQVDNGEFVTFVGHSGAGKTTLIKLILGEEYPSDGSVYFESQNIHKLSSYALRELRRRMGVVFQDFRLLRNRTARENIEFAMASLGKTDEEIESDVPYILDLVGLTHRENHFPFQLSGGERQRLAIARALINEPDIIIADEPTGNLDLTHTKEVVDLLKKVNELGTTIILATHDTDVLKSLKGKGRVIAIDDGKLVDKKEDGKEEE